MALSALATRMSRAVSWVADAKSSKAAFAHTLFSRLFLVLINFCTGVVVARSLAPQGRGEQAAISIWPVILSGVFAFGIPIAIRYRVPRSQDRARAYYSTALLLAVSFGLVAAGVGWVFVPHWLAKYDAKTIRFAQYMLFFTPGSMGLYIVQSYLEATGRFRQSNAVVYAPPASTLIALLIMAATHVLTPFSSALAYFVPTNCLFFWRLWTLRENLLFPIVRIEDIIRSLFSYGVKAYGIELMVTLSTQVDQALVIRFLSASQLGVYTVALAVSRLLNHLSVSLTTVLLPKASALEKSQAIALVVRTSRVTLLATACGAIALAIVTPFIVPFFYGHDFGQAVHISQILFLEVTFNATINVLAQAFLATGRPGIVTAFQGVGLATTIPLMLFMIPRYGLTGAALSLLASTTLRLVFVMGCFPALLHLPIPNIIPNSDDFSAINNRLRRRTTVD